MLIFPIVLTAKKTPSKPQTPAQNGKGPKPNTPAKQQNKTPEKKKKDDKKTTPSPKTPQTPRVFTVPELKAKIMASVEKVCFLLEMKSQYVFACHKKLSSFYALGYNGKFYLCMILLKRGKKS